MTKPLGKLKPGIKKKWIAALESDKYVQDSGRLRSNNGYCCLGVCYDILKKGVWESEDCHLGGLPDDVKVQIGLSNRAEDKLVNMNDNRKYSFKKIAQYIKRHL